MGALSFARGDPYKSSSIRLGGHQVTSGVRVQGARRFAAFLSMCSSDRRFLQCSAEQIVAGESTLRLKTASWILVRRFAAEFSMGQQRTSKRFASTPALALDIGSELLARTHVLWVADIGDLLRSSRLRVVSVRQVWGRRCMVP
jgi:hypothetical protein